MRAIRGEKRHRALRVLGEIIGNINISISVNSIGDNVAFMASSVI